MKRLSLLLISLFIAGSSALTPVSAASPVDDFVERLYKLCLNRKSDASGKKYWVDSLNKRQKSASEVAHGFFFSKEMQNMKLSNANYVEKCYQVLMDRRSDAGGKKYWINHLENGMSREYVLKGFLDSQEFKKICAKYRVLKGDIKLTQSRDKNAGVTSFVARNYTKILGRKFDEAGLNNWVKSILSSSNQKQKAVDTVYSFLHSTEFKNKKLSNKEYVKVLYRAFLNREADASGLNYWVNQLSSGKTRDQVAAGFAESKEFGNMLNSYKLTGSITRTTTTAPSTTVSTSPTSTSKTTRIKYYGSAFDMNSFLAEMTRKGYQCEGVAIQYLWRNGYPGVYELWAKGTGMYDVRVNMVPSRQIGDIIAYYDSTGLYRHTAVYIGDGKAVHGNFNGKAVVASADGHYAYQKYFRPSDTGKYLYVGFAYAKEGGYIQYKEPTRPLTAKESQALLEASMNAKSAINDYNEAKANYENLVRNNIVPWTDKDAGGCKIGSKNDLQKVINNKGLTFVVWCTQAHPELVKP